MPLEVDLDALSQEQLEYIWWRNERKRCQEDLLYLCREYLDYHDLNDKLHGPIAERLKTWKDLLILLPRGHLKSSLITIGKTIQFILNNQNVRIKIINAAYSKATEFLAEIKEHLKNEKLLMLFPEILYSNPDSQSDCWRRDAINVKRTAIVAGNTIEVLGIDTGNIGKHCDIIIFDDPHDDKNTRTAELIEYVKRRFTLCLSVLDPGGLRLVIGTRWKNEDIYGDLIRQEWEYVEEKIKTDDGDFILPEIWNEKKLKKVYEGYRDAGFSSLYYAQYENRIVDVEDIVFPKKFIVYFIKTKLWSRVYIIIDPAIDEKAQSCETVIQTVCQTEDNKLYVRRSHGFRGGVQETVDGLFLEYLTYADMYEISVGVEKVAYQKALHQWIERDQVTRGIAFEVIELEPHGRSKDYRIRALGPFFRRGIMLLHKRDCEKLPQQLIDYGATTRKDHADALAYLPDMLIMTSGNEVLEMGASPEDPYSLESILGEEEAVGCLDY